MDLNDEAAFLLYIGRAKSSAIRTGSHKANYKGFTFVVTQSSDGRALLGAYKRYLENTPPEDLDRNARLAQVPESLSKVNCGIRALVLSWLRAYHTLLLHPAGREYRQPVISEICTRSRLTLPAELGPEPHTPAGMHETWTLQHMFIELRDAK